MATTYTYTAATGGEKVIIEFNDADSMYKVSGDSGVIFNIKKDDIEKISVIINAGNIGKLGDMITVGNIETANVTTAEAKPANVTAAEAKPANVTSAEETKSNGTAQINVETGVLSSNVNPTNVEVTDDIIVIADMYNKIITMINNAIGLPPTANGNYATKLSEYKAILAKYNKWNDTQGSIISNITDDEVDGLSADAIETTISDTVDEPTSNENILKYFNITMKTRGGNTNSRGGGDAFSAVKPDTSIDKLRKLIYDHTALINKLKSQSGTNNDDSINELTKQINSANKTITELLLREADSAANNAIPNTETPAVDADDTPDNKTVISAIVSTAAAASSAAADQADATAPVDMTADQADATAHVDMTADPAPVDMTAASAPAASATADPADATAPAAAADPAAVPGSTPAVASAVASAAASATAASTPAAAASAASAASATAAAPAADSATADPSTVAATAPISSTAAPSAVPATDPYSKLIKAFTENIDSYTELAKLDSLSSEDVTITIGEKTEPKYQIKFNNVHVLTQPDKKYYIQLLKKQIFITVKALLLKSLQDTQTPLFDKNICGTKSTVNATNKNTIIKDTLCKVINPIIQDLFAYNNKIQNSVNNQSNYDAQEQYYKNANILIETLRSQRNLLRGNKDANEHIDKLKEQRKKLERILYKHYETIYTNLGDLDKIDDAIKNAERLSVNDIDTKALIDSIKTWYGKIKADHSKYRTEFYNKYKQYGSWKQTVTPGRFRGGENKTRRAKNDGKKKTRKI